MRIAVCALLFGLMSPLAAKAADGRFAAGLQAADNVRSANPGEFRRRLAALERDESTATPADREYLRLLRDYRQAIDGHYGASIGDAITLYDQAGQSDIKYRAALLIANTAAVTRDFVLGLRYLERALQMQASVSSSEHREAASVVASSVYNEYGQYVLGRHYAERVLASGAVPRAKCIARQNLVEARYRMGESIDESTDVQSAITYCLAQKEVIPASFIRATLARRWSDEGKTAQALSLLNGALADAEATRYTRLIGEYDGLLAQLYLRAGKLDAAAEFAQRVVAAKGQDPRWTPAVSAHHVLYQIALGRGDYQTALAEYRAYSEADKARLDDIKAREYAFQLSRHELNQKNQSIALLKSQNQLLRLQQQATRASAWNTRLAIALLLVLVASVGYWGWRARRTHGSLRTLAETDGLTGLANRRHFRARSEAALALCAQRSRPACVLLFDLDHFKQINDQCGHSSGDWVLREVARVGRLHCREQDLFGRIGGEEFAMTLVDCDAEAAMRTAEACRRAIAAIDASQAGCGQPVAASIGVVSTVASGYEYEALIAHADAAMYRSKVAGRNRVTLYERPPVPQPGIVPAIDRRNAEAMLKQY